MSPLHHLRQVLRKARKSNRIAIRFAAGAALAAWRCPRAPFQFCTDGIYRSTALLRLFRPGELHQTTCMTKMDRYPAIFSICRDYLSGRPNLRILSCGCATGEEVFTLRRYFPEAFLVGVEINRHSLSIAKRRTADDRMVFLSPDTETIQALGPFDAIFCMAVLQRQSTRVERERTPSLKKIYPFEKFDDKVMELDSWLKPSGLMIVHFSQYLFSDSSVAPRYTPLPSARNIPDTTLRFDRKSQQLGVSPPGCSVFVKTRDA